MHIALNIFHKISNFVKKLNNSYFWKSISKRTIILVQKFLHSENFDMKNLQELRIETRNERLLIFIAYPQKWQYNHNWAATAPQVNGPLRLELSSKTLLRCFSIKESKLLWSKVNEFLFSLHFWSASFEVKLYYNDIHFYLLSSLWEILEHKYEWKI